MATVLTVEEQKKLNPKQQIYIRSLFGISMSDTESTLKRLIRLCPEIVLEKRELELIIDGKINQVISEHKNEYKVLDQTEEIRLEEDIQEVPQDQGEDQSPEETPTIDNKDQSSEETHITNNEEEHGEYCGCIPEN